MPSFLFLFDLGAPFLRNSNILRNTGLPQKSSCNTDLAQFLHFLDEQLRPVTKFIEPVHGRINSKVQTLSGATLLSALPTILPILAIKP